MNVLYVLYGSGMHIEFYIQQDMMCPRMEQI